MPSAKRSGWKIRQNLGHIFFCDIPWKQGFHPRMRVCPVTHSLPDRKQIFETAEKIVDLHVFCMGVTIIAQSLQTCFFVRLWTCRIIFKCKLCWEKPFSERLLHIIHFLKSKRQRGAPGFEKI